MMKINRKPVAFLLILAIVLSMMPFTALASGETYTVTVRGSRASDSRTGAGRYQAGETVSIDAGSRDGYIFDGWSSTRENRVAFDNRNRARTSFTMPAGNVTITANWVDERRYDDRYYDDWRYDDRYYDDRWDYYDWWYNDRYCDAFQNNRYCDYSARDGRCIYCGRAESRRTATVTPSRANTPTATPAAVTTVMAHNATQDAISSARKAGSKTATANLKNPGGISLTTLQMMVDRAAFVGMTLRLQADTMTQKGSIDVRITLDPALAARSLNLSASTGSAQANQAANHFGRIYSNDIMAIAFEEQDGFGLPVTISVRLTAISNTENLVFYTYDKGKNSYRKIPVSDYRVSDNGLVHFSTELAGSIVISDGRLTPKGQ